MPEGAWRAAAAAGAVDAGEHQRVQLWQRIQAVLIRAVAVVLPLARGYLQARFWYCLVGQACALSIDHDSLALPPSVAGELGRFPPAVRVAGTSASALLFVLLPSLLLQWYAVGNWQAVRQTPAWRLFRNMLLNCVSMSYCALLQTVCQVRWDAPGAPAKQPASAVLTDFLLPMCVRSGSLTAAAPFAFVHAICGWLTPHWIAARTTAGYCLLRMACATFVHDLALEQAAQRVHWLFLRRPAALSALHAALA